MPKKSDNYFVRVAKYQKQHPRATRAQAMSAVSKEISGIKRRTKTKKSVVRKPRKKSIIKTERITTIGKRKTVSNPVSKGISISKRIEDLELLLKHTKGTATRNDIKRKINAEHDKLDAVTKRLKSA